jgi:hypothetical protein
MNAIVALALPGACFWAKAQVLRSASAAYPSLLDPRVCTSGAACPDRIESRRQRSPSTVPTQRPADTDRRKRIWAIAAVTAMASIACSAASPRRAS